MKCLLFLLVTILLSASSLALPVSDMVPDPLQATGAKFYSPNGVYSFWMSKRIEAELQAPIMDGPLGLLHPGLESFQNGSYDALVNNAGLAVAVIAGDFQSDPNDLYVFTYSGHAYYLMNNTFDWPGFYPGGVTGGVSIEGGFRPLSLTDTVFTAMVEGRRGDGVYVRVPARWNLSGGDPVIIPEPSTYILMVSALGLLAFGRRYLGTRN
jgi:hypothetical protein